MEQCVLRLVEALRDRGSRVLAVCPDEGPACAGQRALGCGVLVTPVGDDPSFARVRDAASLVLDEGVDIVHAHFANAHVLAALVAAATGRPCLATLHGPQVGMLDLEAHRLTRHGHLHAVHEAAIHHARSIGVAASRVHLVRNHGGAAAGDWTPDMLGRLHGLLCRLASGRPIHGAPEHAAAPAAAGGKPSPGSARSA
jgi:hypothetical protein